MPTTRRRRNRERTGAGGLTETMYLFFSGGPYFEAEAYEQETTPAEREALWREHRGAILTRYLAELRERPAWAGHRPERFWAELEAQGYKRQKVGTRERWEPWSGHGTPSAPTVYDVLEDDYEFLRRLGLLEPWELDARTEKAKGANT